MISFVQNLIFSISKRNTHSVPFIHKIYIKFHPHHFYSQNLHKHPCHHPFYSQNLHKNPCHHPFIHKFYIKILVTIPFIHKIYITILVRISFIHKIYIKIPVTIPFIHKIYITILQLKHDPVINYVHFRFDQFCSFEKTSV